MKKSKLWLLPILAAPALVGCNSESSGSVNLTIWEDQSNIAVVKTLCDEFIANYRQTYPNAPKITVEFVEHAEKSAVEALSVIAESGEGPDIAAITHDTIAAAVSGRLITPALFSSGVKERMTDEAVNAVSVNGEIYGYPITAESVTIMYDSSKVSASELASWEALKASGKKIGMQLTDDDGGYYTWGFYNDSVLFGDDGKHASQVNIGTSQSVANVLEFYKNYFDCVVDGTPESLVSNFGASRNAIVGLVSSPFILESVKNKIGDNNLKLATLPTLAGQTMRPFSGYKCYVVNRYSKNGAIAHALCDYITSYDANLYRLKQLGYLPACPLDATSRIAQAINADERAKVYAQSLENSMVMPNIDEMGNFWSAMNNACGVFANNHASLTENSVKSKLQEVTNALLGITG